MANYIEKENIFIKIAKYLFPWKGDSITEIIRKVIFLAAAVVLVVSLVSLLMSGVDKVEDDKNNSEIADIYHGVTSGNTQVQIDTSKQEQIKEENPEILEEFVPLLEINEDIVGWFNIGGEDDTQIDHVVVQGEDNDFYLDHNYKKEESISGALFTDFRDPITADSQPANIIIYGHNMASGDYFAKLLRYHNYKPYNNYGLEYYKDYPTITFSTLYEKSTYKIFAGMIVNTRSKHGQVFDYLNNRNFESKAEFDEYIANILDRSTFLNPDINLKYGDELLTLSTCSFDYDYNRNLGFRWVVFARKVREGEDPTVDVSKVYDNPDPLYFEYYYNTYGGSWGGRKWPAEMIQGYSY